MRDLITTYTTLVVLDRKYWMIQEESCKPPKDKYFTHDDIWNTDSMVEFEII